VIGYGRAEMAAAMRSSAVVMFTDRRTKILALTC
jgi:hypothetical protein